MASILNIVLCPEDESTLFAFIAGFELQVYPEFFPGNYEPFVATAESIGDFDEEAFYLAAEEMAPMEYREVKRGKNRGLFEIEERQSPVIHYQRSRQEGGTLVAGRLWTELTPDSGHQQATHPEAFRRMWLAIREHLMKQCTRSRPPGWLIGKEAARRYRSGMKLRTADHRGKPLEPFR